MNPQWNSLPTYTANNTGASSVKGNVCSVHGRKQGAPLVPSNRASLQAGDPLVSASASPHHVVGLPPFDIRDLSTSRSRDGRLSEVLSPRGREGRGNAEDTLLERNIVYDRLMSGQATETGEIPPSYGEAVASAARARSASRMGRGTQCEGEAERADGEESGNRSRSRLRQSVVAEGR